MRTGLLAHSDARQGAFVDLWAGGILRRVAFLGPQETRNWHGALLLYRGGQEMVVLRSWEPSPISDWTDLHEFGQLILTGRGPIAAPGGYGVVRQVLLSPDGLRTFGEQRPAARAFAPVPSVDGKVEATLAIAEGRLGGYLLLKGADRVVQIDQTGVHVYPSKAATDTVPAFTMDFVASHPEDATKELHYSVVEGPEAGIYVRGTAKLSRGRALVALPDHFAHLASEQQLTVHLTPRSERSRGVAATKVSPRELEIRELARGRGIYDVDYLVHGIRRGSEGYRVERRCELGWESPTRAEDHDAAR